MLADKGVARMSMEHVAAKAGVAKSTLYRRWPSKIELAVHAVAATFDEIEIEDHGSLEADMRAGHRRGRAPAARPLHRRGVCRVAGRVGP